MKKLEINQMENFQGGELSKCEIGTIGGCWISSAAFIIALGPIGGLWGLGCTILAAAADTCEGKEQYEFMFNCMIKNILIMQLNN